MSKALVIGDPHCNQNRQKAWNVACESIFNQIKQIPSSGFEQCIITGDLFDKTPKIKERVLFAKFIDNLKYYTDNIILIQGTDRHEFTEGTYNYEDLTILTDIKAIPELEKEDYIFGHYEVKGTRYINGYKSESKKEAREDKTYMLGHIHSPSCSFNNVNYVGSMYKVSFAEINDQKRIAVIDNNGKLKWYDIKSLPMFEIKIQAHKGKLCVSGLKRLSKCKGWKDLKIKVETDSMSLSKVHELIYKIKSKHKIEYYKQDIRIKDTKVDVPKNLDQNSLLKKYCEKHNVNSELVTKEVS